MCESGRLIAWLVQEYSKCWALAQDECRSDEMDVGFEVSKGRGKTFQM